MTQAEGAPFSVAIIGAGIGGLALAIGLLKKNVPCTVYESASKFDAVGAGIGLGPNALRAIELMDPKFRAMYDEVKVGNKSPDRVHEQIEILGIQEGFGITDDWHGGSVSHPAFERSSAHRKALLEIMESLIPPGTVQFNKRVIRLEQKSPQKVTIVFQDGEVVQSDIVVGCDGIKGMSRKVVLESRYPEEVPAKYNNTYIYRGITSMEEAKKRIGTYAEDARWWMGKGKGWAMYPISKGTEVNIVAFIHDPDEWVGEQATKEVTREEMFSDFAEFDHRLKALLDFVKPVRWPLFHHPNTPTYYKGRICLMGDSAHASSPAQAAGAGQGLEDALILSRLLGLVRRTNEVESAIQVYDAIRRPRAQAVVQESRDVGMAYFFLHPDFGDDLKKITADANVRLPKIWFYDLDRDLKLAEDSFNALVRYPACKDDVVTVSIAETTTSVPSRIAT
ncbi:hypothetical protein A1O1_02871 [Capronia coronata CBS 617.96]|uniref:FAD-binding domain-containing protein n=1 Tax=Capronia coronata CBS 617.96 TaxID=1182541 RepID=W9YXT1_9EURO|nr:uncharacterized protein A1O1_02871 [Capronia coronata CBS 617.96]EXJ94475.1 hypothetical protein A1O1_02871 [Capronia coronata CBS 617.96]